MNTGQTTRLPGLLDEPVITLYPTLAIRTGVNKALILQQVHFYCAAKEKQGEDGWIYNTYEDWQARHFPWLSVSSVKRMFQELEAVGILLSRPHESDSRTKAYRINYGGWGEWFALTPDDDKKRIEIGRKCGSKESASETKADQNDPELRPKMIRESGSKESDNADQNDPESPIYKESEESSEIISERSPENSSSETRPNSTDPDPTPSGDDDDDWNTVLKAGGFVDWLETLFEPVRAKVRAMTAITAWAWWLDTKDATTPGAALAARLGRSEDPTPGHVQEARDAIRLRREMEAVIGEAEQIAERREGDEWDPRSPFFRRQRDTPPPPPSPTELERGKPTRDPGLDEKPAGHESTWEEIWVGAKGNLSLSLNRATFETWMQSAEADSYADGVLTLRVKNDFVREYLDTRLKHAVEKVVQNWSGCESVTVAFVCAPVAARV